MADIYPDTDGVVYKYITSAWAVVRRSLSGTLNTLSSYNITNSHTAGRGSNAYNIGRYFLLFDTSGIGDTLDSATLNIYGTGESDLDVIVLQGGQLDGSSVASTDFEKIDNASTPLSNSDGSGTGTFAGTSVVEFSSEVTTWSTSGYNNISLNSDALEYMVDEDSVLFVIIGYDYDYLDIAPSGIDPQIGFYQDAYTGTSRDPYITYNVATAVTDNSVFFGTNF